jgi:hypothetical protein
MLLRLEGAAIFGASLFLYRMFGGGWGFFLLLCLWPDLSMLGYLANARIGAGLYNLVHTDLWPLIVAIYAFAVHRPTMLLFALIWLAHIGMDRMLGYGLKYPTFFKDTHLQRVSA